MASNKSKLQYPNKKQFMITVPKSLVLAKGWKQGDTLEFVFNDRGEMVLRKLENKKTQNTKTQNKKSEKKQSKEKSETGGEDQ